MKASRPGSWLSLVFASFAAFTLHAHADPPPTVTLPSGAQLVGVYNKWTGDPTRRKDLLEWRGIRYAAPPLGQLRWRPPAPLTLTGTIDAMNFRNACTQPGDPYSGEDCLFLNVSVPAAPVEQGPLAVIVDIHGGGNNFGSAGQDSGGLTRHDVVVVTFNYRLNGLGFLALPQLSAEGREEGNGTSSNYGIRDQIAALQWVHTNISAFGGDPSRVTITGFSAGAGDVITLMASPLANLPSATNQHRLFHRAAPSAFNYWHANNDGFSLNDSEQLGLALAGALGCPSAQDPDLLTCMRNVPVDVLAQLFSDWTGGAAATVDGYVLPKSVVEMIRDPSNPPVPLLAGDGREELGDIWFDPGFPKDIHAGLFNHITTDEYDPKTGAKLRKFYPVSDYGGSFYWDFVHFFSDEIGVCPTRKISVANANRAPTWRYLFTRILDNDPSAKYTGASHGRDVTLLWDGTWYLQSDAEKALAFRMSKYLTNFAKTGDPNGSGLPHWDKYSATSEPYMEYGDTATLRTGGYHVDACNIMDVVPRQTVCDATCHWFTFAHMPAVAQKLIGIFKYTVCHNGQSIEVLGRNLQAHLDAGDEYGACIAPATLPGKVEAENYAYGGEGIAYHDNDRGNNGGAYRIDDVDVRQTLDHTGYQVGWNDTGEWRNYNVNVAQGGNYKATAHVTSGCCDWVKSMHLEINGVNVSGPIDIQFNDNWDIFHDVTVHGVYLPQGSYTLRMVNDVGPFDIDWVNFERE